MRRIMEKFVIKNADGSEQNVMPAVHDSHRSAREAILNYMKDNIALMGDKINFNFIIECAPLDTNELAPDFESAKKIIGSKEFVLAKESLFFQDVEASYEHIGALIALNQLFTIAQAWNKVDGFVPDFSNYNQEKWFPWFRYDTDDEKFVPLCTHHTSTTSVSIDSRLCFKTSERAEQFGRQFESLYNKVFCNK